MITELSEFSVVKNSNKVEIKWCISDEQHTLDYIVEKSNDGKKFSTLIDIPCTTKNNNFHEYFEVDFHPANYYRLKLITDDHVAHYSELIYIRGKQAKHPVKMKNTEVLVVLRDQVGNEYSSKIIVNSEKHSLSGNDDSKLIPKGNYLIIASEEETLNGKKITIN